MSIPTGWAVAQAAFLSLLGLVTESFLRTRSPLIPALSPYLACTDEIIPGPLHLSRGLDMMTRCPNVAGTSRPMTWHIHMQGTLINECGCLRRCALIKRATEGMRIETSRNLILSHHWRSRSGGIPPVRPASCCICLHFLCRRAQPCGQRPERSPI